MADPRDPRREIGGEEKAGERHAVGAGDGRDGIARSAGAANTASTIAEWPAAMVRRALSTSTA